MKEHKPVSNVPEGHTGLSPNDLYNHEFSRVLAGGYRPQEVDRFLERAADAMESLIREVARLKEQQQTYEAKLQEYQQVEQALRSALVTSQRFGEELVQSAKREAETLVEAARLQKERLEAEAAKLPAALAQEIARLEEQRDRLRSELEAVLKSHEVLLRRLSPAEERVSAPAPGGTGTPSPAGTSAKPRSEPTEPPVFPPRVEAPGPKDRTLERR